MKMTSSPYRILVSFLLLVNSTGALIAGWSFMRDPSGTGVGISIDWLRYSPFSDFFVPGLLLFIVNGLFGIMVFMAIQIRSKYYSWMILIQGVLLAGWIVTQMAMLHTINYLQVVCLVMAIVLVWLGYIRMNHEKPRNSKRRKVAF